MRIASVVATVPDADSTSICASDYTATLDAVAARMGARMQGGCLPGAVVDLADPGCSVSVGGIDAPRCSRRRALPCWDLVADMGCPAREPRRRDRRCASCSKALPSRRGGGGELPAVRAGDVVHSVGLSPRAFIAAVAAVIAVAAALYVPSLGHDFVVDDAYYIGDNDAVTRGAPLAAYFFDRSTTASRADFTWQSYRPVRTIAFRALVAAFGVRPLPFGVANLVLYAVAIALVAGLAWRVAGDGAAALAAAALWALLPVHVEPVAYASALGDQLSLVFQLLAFIAAARAIARPRLAVLAALASLVAAALAMGAKEMAVTEGPILAAGVACAWRSLARDARRRAVGLVAAHAVVTLGFLVLRTHVIGAVGQGAITALTARIAVRAIPIYLWKYLVVIAAPLGHAAAYAAVPLARARAAMAWLGVVAVGARAVARAPDHRRPRPHASPPPGSRSRWCRCCTSCRCSPTTPIASPTCRRSASPSPSPSRSPPPAAGARSRSPPPAALAVVYAVAVPLEARAWRDELTLWRHAVDVQPDAALAQSNLGIALLRAQAPAEALVHLRARPSASPAAARRPRCRRRSRSRRSAATTRPRRRRAVRSRAEDTPAGRAILARISAEAAASRR